MTIEPLSNDDLDDEHLESGDAVSGNITLAPGHTRLVDSSTVATYLRFVKTIRRKVVDQNPGLQPEEVRPTDIVDHLVTYATTFRPKTAINYRSGVLYWLNTLPETPETLHARLSLEVAFPKRGFKPSRSGKAPESIYSTKSSRARTFNRRRFMRLLDELSRRSSGNERQANRAQELMYWLRAGLASGLRPIEWADARWEDRTTGRLRVLTAKKKAGTYAMPAIAHLHPPAEKLVRLVEVDEADRPWVDMHLSRVLRHLRSGGSYHRYYENNRIYLYMVSQELFGQEERPFTLYMMRGQFSANRKRRGESREDVAASMGSSAKVNGTYYGQAKYGHHSSAETDIHGVVERPIQLPQTLPLSSAEDPIVKKGFKF